MKNSYFNENTIQDLLNEIEYVYQSDQRPWIIGYSGGKDSTTADMLEVMYAIAEARGYSIAELEQVRAAKAAERGAFQRCIYLDGVEEST